MVINLKLQFNIDTLYMYYEFAYRHIYFCLLIRLVIVNPIGLELTILGMPLVLQTIKPNV